MYYSLMRLFLLSILLGCALASSGPEKEIGSSANQSGQEKPHRYEVFSISFESVISPYIVSLWIFFASVAKIGFHMNNKLSSIFPESCLLIILGIIVGIILYFSAKESAEFSTLNASTFFHYLLPPIILDAGYFMPNRAFFNNIGTILLYAVVGTLWNTATIGLTLYGASRAGWLGKEIQVLHCLVFSSLISAVDPVAVLAVFEEIHVNEQLHIVVFGESLLNDAVTVVLYHMFMEYSLMTFLGRDIIWIDIMAGVAQFFIVGIGGVLIGVVFGLFCAIITRFTSHVRVIEPIFVFLLAYLSYLTAEMFHLSGIMALTFCGIVMKQYVLFNISEKSQTTIKYFLKMLSSMTETVIFMMLGTSIIKDDHDWDITFILITIISCLVYRAIGVLGLTAMANTQRLSKLSMVDQFVMAYGGLRGAIAFALAILLRGDIFPQKSLFVTTTILVVMFTVFVQGITIKPLVHALRVKKSQKKQSTMNEQIHERLLDHTMSAVEDITGFHGNHWLRDKWEFYNSKYLKRILLRERPKTKEHGILRVHSRLSLKDAMESAEKGYCSSTTNLPGLKNEQSLLRIIKNWSVTSFQDAYPSSCPSDSEMVHTDTVVDMQALEAHYSKKLADDTKTHHLLGENLIKPSKKMTKHVKHSLNDEKTKHRSHIHHNVRLHLRHMISKHSHMAEEKRKQRAQDKLTKTAKLPKNVSFAQLEVTHPHCAVHFVGQTDIAEDQEDELGITFTASTDHILDDDQTDINQYVAPVALECNLPWKRGTSVEEVEPLCSLTTHLLPDDNKPELACVPAWADNLDYNNIPALSPRSDMGDMQEDTETVIVAFELSEDSSCSAGPLLTITAPSSESLTGEGKSQLDEVVAVSDETMASADSLADLIKHAEQSRDSEDEEDVPIKPFGNLKIDTSFAQIPGQDHINGKSHVSSSSAEDSDPSLDENSLRLKEKDVNQHDSSSSDIPVKFSLTANDSDTDSTF